MLLFDVFIDGTVNPNEACHKNQCHGRHGHHAIVHVKTAILHKSTIWNDLEIEQCAETENLADETYGNKHNGIAETIANTIKEAFPRTVLHGKCLKTSHQDTVGDDQSHRSEERRVGKECRSR